ncbi:MAG: amidohydrolase [Burkholderiaceae bacterium]
MVKFTGANRLMGDRPGVFDGHAHVFDASLLMAPNRRYTPDASAFMDDYVGHLNQAGLSGAILVQPSFLGSDNRYLLDAIRQGNSQTDLRFGCVVVVEAEIAEEELNAFASAGVIGLRLNLIGQDKPLDLARWAPVLRFAQAHNWHVELHCEGPRLAGLLDALSDKCPRIVVDHFGLPNPAAPLKCEGLQAVARMPAGQVFVKLSAPYRVFKDLPSADAMLACLPLVDALLAAVGPEQLLWGSDWPWTQFEGKHRYSDCVSWLELMSTRAG